MYLKRNNVNILIIDQATINTSYTIISIRDGVPSWVECSKILLPQIEYQDRIMELYNKVGTLIDENAIEILVLEQVPPIVQNFHTTSVLLKLMGTLELLCKQKGVECVMMNVVHWKHIAGITSKGRALQKRESIALAWDRWKPYQDIIKGSDDVADALNMSYAFLVDEGYIKKKTNKKGDK